MVAQYLEDEGVKIMSFVQIEHSTYARLELKYQIIAF